ncbi:MAG: hypothetical protein C0498_02990 [Anaerolinea sp.]|nr:hypothetical protein [Anaerolinea sp.]
MDPGLDDPGARARGVRGGSGAAEPGGSRDDTSTVDGGRRRAPALPASRFASRRHRAEAPIQRGSVGPSDPQAGQERTVAPLDVDNVDDVHLIDPRTGEPGGNGLVAVTVATRDPAWAEVWSKALFLEGHRAIAAAARARGLAAGVRTAWVAAEA